MGFGSTMKKAFTAPAKALMNAPGMGAIRKPLSAGMNALPGSAPVASGLGLGPSRPPAPMMNQSPPQMQQLSAPPPPDMGPSPEAMQSPTPIGPPMQQPGQGAPQGIGPSFGGLQQMRRPMMNPRMMPQPQGRRF